MTLEAGCLLLAGPTAVGKSAVALSLAERLNGEIVSVDSMQVYRGLDIGTAKPSAEDRARVPHHLIDVVQLTGSFDAARFVSLARDAVREIQARGRVPIFCGGTGLYFQAWLEGLGEAPGAEPGLRAQLEAAPLADLLHELAEADPATYAAIDRQNPRRVVRAVEAIRLTGRPFSELRAAWTRPDSAGGAAPAAPRHFYFLERPAAELRERIHARVDVMFARGLVEETRQLLERGLADNPTACQALGYRQVLEHLRGRHSLAETILRVKQGTTRYARRQRTWFRHRPGVEFVPCGPADPPERIAEGLAARWKQRPPAG